MQESDQLLNAYFDRIGFRGKAKPDYLTLKILQELQVQHIPFENFNPLLKLLVSLKPEDLFKKLVHNKRGGYCFEQNLLFLNILKTLGFNARGLTGRVILNRPKATITQRTHMLVMVEIKGKKYICDTGFGGQVLPSPIRFITNKPQKTRLEDYQIIDYKKDFILQVQIKKKWKNLYKFDLQEQYDVDYKLANWYTSTHPDSHFTKSLTVTRVGKNSRYILHNNEFVIHYPDQKSKKRNIQSVKEIFSILHRQFDLHPPRPEVLTRIIHQFINV